MPRKIVIIGAAGQIGRQLVRTFRVAGWSVTGIRRTQGCPDMGVETIALDRNEPGALERAVGDGADVLVDIVASTADHARQLVQLQAKVGAIAVISSASVYCDGMGRTLAEASRTGYPELPVPIPETWRTVRPGNTHYSARKAAIEQILLDELAIPLAILRPGAVYGPGCRSPREWWVLKRLLDGRSRIPLAFAGESRFHTSATMNIAELLRVAVTIPGTHILNAADPAAPTASDIVQAIAAAVGQPVVIDPLTGAPENRLGLSPWTLPHPFVLDMTAAEALGYHPRGSYDDLVAPACNWMVDAIQARSWQDAFPALASSAGQWFDYKREDVRFAERAAATEHRS